MVAGRRLGLGDGVVAPGESGDPEEPGTRVLVHRAVGARGLPAGDDAVGHFLLTAVERRGGQREHGPRQRVAGVVDLAPDDLTGLSRVDHRALHPLTGGQIQGLGGGVDRRRRSPDIRVRVRHAGDGGLVPGRLGRRRGLRQHRLALGQVSGVEAAGT